MINWHHAVKTDLTGPVVAGLVALFGGFGGFAAWAALAPIEGAVVAPATIAVEGWNKTIQHLEGGIVEKILVSDGNLVGADQPLLVLDGTAAKALANRLRAQLANVEAAQARALAERDGAETLSIPHSLLTSNDPEVKRVVEDQQATFAVGLREHRAAVAVLDQQIAALEEKISGHSVQRAETAKQLTLLAEERTGLEILLKKGLTRKSQVLALKRTEAELKGRMGQLDAAVAETRKAIAELLERIEQVRSVRVSESSVELSKLRLARTELQEHLHAAEEVRGRLVVRAPASGTVVDLAKTHVGSVIAPGQNLMTIVPKDAGLVIEARVSPRDIDQVHVGQEARIRFSAFDPRQIPPVSGRVVYVSADRLKDQRTNAAYYHTRLEIAADLPAGFELFRLSPGQDAEVFITTGARTFFAYIADPLTKSLARAFRES